eukprot:355302-Chlamydomonas_euryale.AAC.6
MAEGSTRRLERKKGGRWQVQTCMCFGSLFKGKPGSKIHHLLPVVAKDPSCNIVASAHNGQHTYPLPSAHPPINAYKHLAAPCYDLTYLRSKLATTLCLSPTQTFPPHLFPLYLLLVGENAALQRRHQALNLSSVCVDLLLALSHLGLALRKQALPASVCGSTGARWRGEEHRVKVVGIGWQAVERQGVLEVREGDLGDRP